MSSNSKETSILIQLSNKSLKNATFIGLIGSVLWLIVMLFHFLNGAAGYPLNSNLIRMTSDAFNILTALFLLLFVFLLFKYQTSTSLKRTFFILFLGFLLRLVGRLTETVINALVNIKPISPAVYYFADICNLLGITAFTVLMLIFFLKEKKGFYKAISLSSFIFGLLHIGVYVLILLLDLKVIQDLNAQVTRSVSFLFALTFFLYFLRLLLDSVKLQKSSSNTLNL